MDANRLSSTTRSTWPGRLARTGLVAAGLLAFGWAAPAAVADPAGATGATKPAPIDRAVGGVAPAEWTVRWWRWVRSFPEGLAPYLDRDGSRCALGQDEDGPVWFLAGTNGRFDAKRRCEIPLDKHLLIPVINMYHHAPRVGEYAVPCAELKARGAVNNDALVSAVVLLDGKPLGRPARWISRCFDPFALRADSGAVQDAKAAYHAAADGYWLLLPPLPPGKHRLAIGANYASDGDGRYGRMVQNFEYELQIGEPAI
ncbi:hypothetical protein [Lysobacter sp. CA199]|uniref:hypothetical protein n=1 Tax=Lysobacter sp. CA199 TaxID=3455608 RepID=UPI003F8D57AA